jgi:hypothetical protein
LPPKFILSCVQGRTSSPHATETVDTNFIGISIASIAVSGKNIYAGTSRGVFLSSDNGVSWKVVNTGLKSIRGVDFVASGANIVAGTDAGTFLSTNSGASWAATKSRCWTSGDFCCSLALCDTFVFVGGGCGVMLATDNRTSWTALNTGMKNETIFSLAVSGNRSGGTNLFASSNRGVLLSMNNGTAWTVVSTGLTNTNVFPLATSNSMLFAGTDGSGVWRRALSEMTDNPK